MATESVSITTVTNDSFLISGYIGLENSLFTFPGAPQVDVTTISDSNNAVDFIVSYKGAISPPKQDAVSYEADLFGEFMMMVGVLQPRLNPVGSTVKVFG